MKRLIIAVDPGKASGICAFEFSTGESNPTLMMSGEFQPEEYAAPIRELIEHAIANDYVLEFACERFTISAQTAKNSQAPYSLEQIGVLKQIMRDYGFSDVNLKYQSPADAKRMFGNDALKKLEYWHKGGAGHALDAIRHGLLYLANHGWTPMKLLEGY
jgi:hypothetical protein